MGERYEFYNYSQSQISSLYVYMRFLSMYPFRGTEPSSFQQLTAFYKEGILLDT